MTNKIAYFISVIVALMLCFCLKDLKNILHWNLNFPTFYKPTFFCEIDVINNGEAIDKRRLPTFADSLEELLVY